MKMSRLSMLLMVILLTFSSCAAPNSDTNENTLEQVYSSVEVESEEPQSPVPSETIAPETELSEYNEEISEYSESPSKQPETTETALILDAQTPAPEFILETSEPSPTPEPTPTPESSPTPEPTPTPEPSPTPEPVVEEEAKTEIVYITRTGEKYHVSGCRYLSKSKIEISLEDAKNRGFEPCSVCNPPE